MREEVYDVTNRGYYIIYGDLLFAVVILKHVGGGGAI